MITNVFIFIPVRIYTCADLHLCEFTPVRIYICADLQATRKNTCAELQATRIYTYREKTPTRKNYYRGFTSHADLHLPRKNTRAF